MQEGEEVREGWREVWEKELEDKECGRRIGRGELRQGRGKEEEAKEEGRRERRTHHSGRPYRGPLLHGGEAPALNPLPLTERNNTADGVLLLPGRLEGR